MRKKFILWSFLFLLIPALAFAGIRVDGKKVETFKRITVEFIKGLTSLSSTSSIFLDMVSDGGHTTFDIKNTGTQNAILSVNSTEIVGQDSEVNASVIEDKFLRNDGNDTTSGKITAEGGFDAYDQNITNVGDIALDSISSDDGTGVKIKQLKTLSDNDGITLTTADAGQTTTVDSGSAQTVVLPSVAAGDVGIWFRVVKLGAGQVTVDAVDSDTIADSGAGNTIYCSITTEDYASITLQLASTTEWIVTGAHGTWTTTD